MAPTLLALAGALLGAIFVVHPSTAEVATLKAFVVVILGGMGSFPGAVAGGLILGIVVAIEFSGPLVAPITSKPACCK